MSEHEKEIENKGEGDSSASDSDECDSDKDDSNDDTSLSGFIVNDEIEWTEGDDETLTLEDDLADILTSNIISGPRNRTKPHTFYETADFIRNYSKALERDHRLYGTDDDSDTSQAKDVGDVENTSDEECNE